MLNQDRMASFPRQDGNSILQDRRCNRHTVEIHDRMVTVGRAKVQI